MVAEIPKNSREVLRVSRTTFKGHDLLDVRVFYLDPTGVDEPKPTKKGLTLSLNTWAELLPVIQDAVTESADYPIE